MRYIFPQNNKAYCNTRKEQAAKVLEEANEIIKALEEIGNQNSIDAHVVEECFDVIQAVEGVLRKYPKHFVELIKTKTIIKCYRRGDYE